MELRKSKMVGVKFLIPAEWWETVAPLLKEEAMSDFGRHGRLVPGTWNREVLPSDEEDNHLVIVYTADVIPHHERVTDGGS